MVRRRTSVRLTIRNRGPVGSTNKNDPMNALAWLITPAAVTTLIFTFAPFYDPPVRWTRRLKTDISIAGGLPEGDMKTQLNEEIEWRARKLLDYRSAFTPLRVLVKWLWLAFSAIPFVLMIIWPPVNKPNEPPVLAPADWMMVGIGVYTLVIYITCIGSGLDLFGRTPIEMMIRDRVRRHDRRWKKLCRLDKYRARRAPSAPQSALRGTALGFVNQSDAMAGWVRSWEARSIGRNTGWIAAGIDARARISLRDKGIAAPNTRNLHP
jgi:hypothetical protein